jgi:acetoin utilization deacetylase AcuC-like enzyme
VWVAVVRVLCDPETGVLRRERFRSLEWSDMNISPACITDLLRVHEPDYLAHLQSLVNTLPDHAHAPSPPRQPNTTTTTTGTGT